MAGWEVFALRYAVHERRAFENFIRARFLPATEGAEGWEDVAV